MTAATNFPISNVKFVDDGGRLTKEARTLLRTLWSTESTTGSGQTIISVLSYGGNTGDDTAAVQQAADAAVGGILFFPAGDYTIDSVNISSNTRIMGEGNIIQRTLGVRTFLVDNVTNVIFDGINWTGKAPAQSGVASAQSANEAIFITDSSKVKVINSIFVQAMYHALSATNSTDIDFSQNQINFCADGINFTGVTRGRIIDNFIYQTCLYSTTPTTSQFTIGIRLDSTDGTPLNAVCTDIVITGNHISKYPYAQAIQMHAGRQVVIGNNQINGSSVGISLNPYNTTDFIDYCTITGNSIVGNSGLTTLPPSSQDAGITVAGGPGSGGMTPTIGQTTIANNSVINGNRVALDAGQGGIVIGYTQGTTIVGNSIQGCGCNAIVIITDEKGFTISGNSIGNTVEDAGVQNGVLCQGSPIGAIVGNSLFEMSSAAGTGVNVVGATTDLVNANNMDYNVTTP